MEDERWRLEEIARTLNDAASKFDQLVRERDVTTLVDELWALERPELRRILFARVLIEQHSGERPKEKPSEPDELPPAAS
jgi:hypothetical protein